MAFGLLFAHNLVHGLHKAAYFVIIPSIGSRLDVAAPVLQIGYVKFASLEGLLPSSDLTFRDIDIENKKNVFGKVDFKIIKC